MNDKTRLISKAVYQAAETKPDFIYDFLYRRGEGRTQAVVCLAKFEVEKGQNITVVCINQQHATSTLRRFVDMFGVPFCRRRGVAYCKGGEVSFTSYEEMSRHITTDKIINLMLCDDWLLAPLNARTYVSFKKGLYNKCLKFL